METTKREISINGTPHEIVTFAEALRRLGMEGRVRDAASFRDDLVVYAPKIQADAGTGVLFSYCAGRVLYAFSGVQKADHLPDESWAWRVINRSVYVVVCSDRASGGDTWLEAVRPAV